MFKRSNFALCLGMNDRELFQRISQGKFDVPAYISPEAKSLLNKIIRIKPSDRPSCETVNHDCNTSFL